MLVIKIHNVDMRDLTLSPYWLLQDEGLDPDGMTGEIIQLKVNSVKFPGDLWTANRPVFVQFLVSVDIRPNRVVDGLDVVNYEGLLRDVLESAVRPPGLSERDKYMKATAIAPSPSGHTTLGYLCSYLFFGLLECREHGIP